MKGIAEHQRAEAKWENLLEKAFLMEDIIANRHSKDKKIHSTFWVERIGPINEIFEIMRNRN